MLRYQKCSQPPDLVILESRLPHFGGCADGVEREKAHLHTTGSHIFEKKECGMLASVLQSVQTSLTVPLDSLNE